MANRLTSLIAVMILSAIFLVQFQFDLDISDSGSTGAAATNNAWKGAPVVEKRCKGRLSGSDVTDCKIESSQAFCTVPVISAGDDADKGMSSSSQLPVPFTCQGPEYDAFGAALSQFADDVPTHGDSWGRRAFGIPSHKTILMLGNADTQQVAQSMACQHANGKVASVAAPLDDKKTAQKITFTNNATLLILTDDKVMAESSGSSPQAFSDAIFQETGYSLNQLDGMIWGLGHDCGAVAANCPNTTQPAFATAASMFDGPMLFISMMADARSEQAMAMRDVIREKREEGQKNMWFISGRRYISKIKLEGATIYGNGDADNKPKTGKYGHRCTGTLGGHPDLLAFDITEFLYHQLFYKSGKTS